MTNWDTTGGAGSAPRATHPTDWGSGEAAYDPNWVVCGLRDGGGNLIYPTAEISAADAEATIPSGWRPQLNTRLKDLYDFVGHCVSNGLKIVTLEQGLHHMKNTVDFGDFTNGQKGINAASDDSVYPHYVVGRDGSASFSPLTL